MTLPQPGTDLRFRLQISGIDLGDFTACSGLGARVEADPQPGDGGSFVPQTPVRITYPNVTLSRVLTADTAKLSRFLAELPGRVARSSARITAVVPAPGAVPVLATWALREVVVVRWTGPGDDSAQGGVATESIELAHQGFL